MHFFQMKEKKMNCKLLALSMIVALGVSSCAQMNTAQKAYVPEEKKETTFTFESPLTKDQKDGLHLTITKADIMDETYKVNDCGAPVQPKAEEKAPAQPQGMAGLLGGLATMAASAAPAVAPAAQNGQTQKVVEKPFLPSNMIAFKVELKSDINHIINFEKSYFLLKDPNGHMHKAKSITADASWAQQNWCATPEQSKAYQTRMNTVRDMQSSIILPKDSQTLYVGFAPNTKEIPGEWKLYMYEIPVTTNAAGITTATDHFNSKVVVKKWETTFKKFKENGTFEKVETKEAL